MSLRKIMPDMVVGHRGASALVPENTLTAFRTAAQQGCTWVEFDVSLLGDGTPVVIHDDELSRLARSKVRLQELTLSDIAKIDVGSWYSPSFKNERIPTLDQTLNLVDELGLNANLEIKVPETRRSKDVGRQVESIAQRLSENTKVASRVLVSSFRLDALRRMRSHLPTQSIALLYEQIDRNWQEHAAQLEAGDLHLNVHHLGDGSVVEQVAEQGLRVRCYTVNEPEQVKDYWDKGLAGVITDHPGRFLHQTY